MDTRARHEKMKAIRDEVLALTSSPLYAYRKENDYFPVIGEGAHDARIVFIGEAPGQNEAKTGRPFCGAAGKILDDLLASIDLPRQSVYVTNIVKDRPQQNRDPLPDEILIYAPFLDRQLEIIQPEIIVTLGRYAMNYVMKKFDLEFEIEPISSAHGTQYEAAAPYGRIAIIPLYHPAAAIYNRDLIPVLMQDFNVIRTMLDSDHSKKQPRL